MCARQLPVLAGLLGVVTLVLGGAAGAADAPGRAGEVGLHYQAAERCPSRAAVVEQLEVRGLRVTSVAVERRLTVEVEPVSPDAARFKGKLTVEASNGRPALSQTVVGQDCGAVVRSLALIAALALSPTIDAAVALPPPETISTGGPAAADQRPDWFVGATGRGMSALGSGPALGLGVFVERLWGQGPGAVATVVFSAATVAPSTVTVPSGSADLRAYLGRLEGCWRGGLLTTERFFLSPCAGMEGGVVRGAGNIDRPLTATRPWFAPVLSGRGAARLTRGVWLSFEASAFFPLVRDTFVFNDPRAIIHQSPAVGAGLEIGLAAAF